MREGLTLLFSSRRSLHNVCITDLGSAYLGPGTNF